MKAYKIRNSNGQKLTTAQLEELSQRLQRQLKRNHFITHCSPIGQSGVKIGLNGKCFTIDVKALGYNGRFLQSWQRKIDGVDYKLTNLPTWEERVMFNDIVNDVFDAMKISAAIKSGVFVVRDYVKGRRSESDWQRDALKPGLVQVDTDSIVKMTDEDLTAMKNARRMHRSELARVRRAEERAQQEANAEHAQESAYLKRNNMEGI